jgi:recombination protein RecA
VEAIKSDGGMVGNHTRVKVVKNKVAPPFKEAEFDIIYGEGISKEGNILDVAVEKDIIQKSGSWFSYNGERLGQGREGVKQILKDNPELCNEIEMKVREAVSLPIPQEGETVESTPFMPVAKPTKKK